MKTTAEPLTEQEQQILRRYGAGIDVAAIATDVGMPREKLGAWLIDVCSLNRAAARVMAQTGARPIRGAPPVSAARSRREARRDQPATPPPVPEPVVEQVEVVDERPVEPLPVAAAESEPEVVDEPAGVPAEPEPAPAAVEEPSPAPAEPDPAAVAPEPAAETDGQRVDRVTTAVLLAQLGPVATFGARWCPVCDHLGQPDGHTPGCSGRLERVTLAVLREA